MIQYLDYISSADKFDISNLEFDLDEYSDFIPIDYSNGPNDDSPKSSECEDVSLGVKRSLAGSEIGNNEEEESSKRPKQNDENENSQSDELDLNIDLDGIDLSELVEFERNEVFNISQPMADDHDSDAAAFLELLTANQADKSPSEWTENLNKHEDDHFYLEEFNLEDFQLNFDKIISKDNDFLSIETSRNDKESTKAVEQDDFSLIEAELCQREDFCWYHNDSETNFNLEVIV
jgi:hypothetical protein